MKEKEEEEVALCAESSILSETVILSKINCTHTRTYHIDFAA